MNNPFNFIHALKNPQAFISQAMQNPQISNNPIAQNAYQMMQKGDSKGLEQIARNLAKQQGVDIDALRKQIGI